LRCARGPTPTRTRCAARRLACSRVLTADQRNICAKVSAGPAAITHRPCQDAATMVCPACRTERAADGTACRVCGAPDDTTTLAPTFSAESSAGSPRTPNAGEGRSRAGIDHGAFTPGTVLAARYRIVGLLGRGGMGEVYRADDLTLGQTVALKFLRGGDDDRDSVTARLRDETRTARQVSHPNVCRVHD